MWIVNGQVINRQRDFTDGNGDKQRGIILVQWSNSALAAIGVKPFTEVHYDYKWYTSTGYTDADVNGTITRTHTTTDKYTLADAKLELIGEMNRQAYQLLQPTDYYVTRLSEKGTAIPASIVTERDQIRTDITTNETNINALATYADVVAYQIAWTPIV